MNFASMTFLESVGLATIVLILIFIAVYLTALLLRNSKRIRIYRMLVDLDEQDLELLERILNEF